MQAQSGCSCRCRDCIDWRYVRLSVTEHCLRNLQSQKRCKKDANDCDFMRVIVISIGGWGGPLEPKGRKGQAWHWQSGCSQGRKLAYLWRLWLLVKIHGCEQQPDGIWKLLQTSMVFDVFFMYFCLSSFALLGLYELSLFIDSI